MYYSPFRALSASFRPFIRAQRFASSMSAGRIPRNELQIPIHTPTQPPRNMICDFNKTSANIIHQSPNSDLWSSVDLAVQARVPSWADSSRSSPTNSAFPFLVSNTLGSEPSPVAQMRNSHPPRHNTPTARRRARRPRILLHNKRGFPRTCCSRRVHRACPVQRKPLRNLRAGRQEHRREGADLHSGY
jgi:hypothetical protein